LTLNLILTQKTRVILSAPVSRAKDLPRTLIPPQLAALTAPRLRRTPTAQHRSRTTLRPHPESQDYNHRRRKLCDETSSPQLSAHARRPLTAAPCYVCTRRRRSAPCSRYGNGRALRESRSHHAERHRERDCCHAAGARRGW